MEKLGCLFMLLLLAALIAGAWIVAGSFGIDPNAAFDIKAVLVALGL